MTAVIPAGPSGSGRRRALSLAAIAVAAGAYAGAVGLATGALALGGELNERLPLDSPVVGALALALIVAVPFTVLAWDAWRDAARTDLVMLVAGLLLAGWIVVELAFVRDLSFLHVVYGLIGAAFAVGGYRALRRPMPATSRRASTTLT